MGEQSVEKDAIEERLRVGFLHVLRLGSGDVGAAKWYAEELAKIAMREVDHERTGWRLYNDLVDRHNGERMHLQSVVAELKSLLRRACGADASEECRFDHGGDCQAHGPFGDGEPCPYPFIRQYLATQPTAVAAREAREQG